MTSRRYRQFRAFTGVATATSARTPQLCHGFEKDDRATDFVTGNRLGALLSRLEIPRVMVEARRTSALSDPRVFGSLAPALLESGMGKTALTREAAFGWLRTGRFEPARSARHTGPSAFGLRHQ